MKSGKNVLQKTICLILGGGAGSRLYPLTKDRSKPAVPIGGKYRLIDIPISNCLNSGLYRIFVLTQYNSASLNKHIKNSFHFDNYSNGFVDILAAEQTSNNMDWFQGTADAVRQSVRNFAYYDFDYILILSGDQLYQMDIEEVLLDHVKQNADVTIATIPVIAADATSFGIMKVNNENKITSFTEKPSMDILEKWSSDVSDELKAKGKIYLASMGIYVFSRPALRVLLNENPKAVDFGKELIPDSINRGMNVVSYAYDGYWTDIGDIKSFFEANIALADDIPQFNMFDNENKIYTRARLLPPAKFSGVSFSRAIVAEGSIIQAKMVENSILGIRSRIDYGTIIKNAYIMGNDYFESLEDLADPNKIPMGIGKDCYIENAIIDKHVRIGDNVIIRGHENLTDMESEHYVIKKGIVVVNKNAIIPSGTIIGNK
ncbi:MAG: glucose-1-phosphate adenylyltransferase [Saprospiraceae bacterium]|jgi:glucose-1-phosphate adenylyltransferase|nr:glucose-1-phosphate adenylyltransferase [Saprospiraceae bacterium]MBK6666073.1 glucose-1-phosphate adenylyltransferase [Saprospiraceae bacterium]MBK7699691.1 glucose-1-phosphate adenylyltransferase [Saprospiraceae bacterium]MBK8828028.1 glucose-1-phosphate adenylyltransferase [Saprospiraceae bacterium]MBK9581308.1 glucose-1-phosphate adenylyltransferase [Saprospiraceae bacterium]